MPESARPQHISLNQASSETKHTQQTMEHKATPMTEATQSSTFNPQSDQTNSVLRSVYGDKSETETTTITSASHLPPTKKKPLLSRMWFRVLMVVLLVFVVVGSVFGAVGFYTFTVAMQMKSQVDEIEVTARGAYDQFKAQNLPGTQASMETVKTQIQGVRSTYEKLSFYGSIPIASAYYKDGTHGLNAADAGIEASLKSLTSVNKYADVLGFAGEGTFTGGSIENRIQLILDTLSKITPELDAIGQDLEIVNQELAQIDPNRYPETLQGKAVRSRIVTAQQFSAGAAKALTEFRPVIEQIPDAAGSNKTRKKYLVLFQNDNEQRPTGGFLTGYATIFVEDGKVTPDKSDDIYELDKNFTKKLPIPPILGKYLTTETKWNMRDMNIDPDFKKSMEQFLANYKNIPGEPKDIYGVVAIDTHVLVKLLEILGPVEVPGYGTFSAQKVPECDCPQIIYAMSEIITRPTPYLRPDRKALLGPMMNAILKKVFETPKAKWPELFAAGFELTQTRDAQFYFFDEAKQAAAEKVGAAGRMHRDPNAEDFLAIIDANLGGAKSNLFIDYTVDQQVDAPTNGTINKKVVITYKNSRHGDNCNLEAGLLCLNARLRDWNRLYLPKGAVLKNSQGYREGSVRTYDEDDFTIIEGEFFLDPLSQSKIQVEYTVPYTNEQEYKVKLWKQGGVDPTPVNFDVNGNQETVTMDKDLVYTAAF